MDERDAAIPTLQQTARTESSRRQLDDPPSGLITTEEASRSPSGASNLSRHPHRVAYDAGFSVSGSDLLIPGLYPQLERSDRERLAIRAVPPARRQQMDVSPSPSTVSSVTPAAVKRWRSR